MAGDRKPTKIDAAIGEKIRARRLELGLSQQSLADVLGLTFQQIQKYEIGANRVSASTLVAIAKALDVHITELLPVDRAATLGAHDPDELIASIAELNRDGRQIVALIAAALAAEKRYRD